MKFIVYTPNYTTHCGGIVALHNLAWELQSLGHEVRLAWTTNYNPEKQVPLMNYPDSEAIAIYPEITPDNPLGVRRCVRWILSPVGEDWKELRKNDMIVSWAKWDQNPVLFVPLVDQRYFNMDGAGNRNVKLAYKTFTSHEEMDLHDYSLELPELAKLFKHAIYLRVGDSNTAVNEMARLCGCPVLMMNPGNPIGGKVGIAYSDNELFEANETISLMTEAYENYKNQSKQLIMEFIEGVKIDGNCK